MDYTFGNLIGPETTSVEYKLFTFFPKGVNLDNNDLLSVEELMYTGKWVFNNSVIDNLIFYLDYYLPKYSTAYLSNYSEVQYGELTIGISDEGIIYGIPYKGDLKNDHMLKFFNDKIKNIINSNLSFDKSVNISDYMRWEIIEIDKKRSIHENCDLKKKINEYENQNEKYKKQLLKFKSKKKVWYDLILRYNDRLHNMLNDIEKRKEVINYILSKDERIKNKSTVGKNHKIISKLKTDYKFSAITNEEINKCKDNIDSIWHWVTKWKDDKIDFLKEIKPIPPSGISSNLYPSSIITTVVDMIPKWIEKEDINLYLIKFIFIKPNKDIDIKYLHESSYKSCYRCNIDDIPCIHPSFF